MGGKGIEAVADKRYLSYSIVNTVGGKNLKAPKRPNKGRKYNSNTLKDRDNMLKDQLYQVGVLVGSLGTNTAGQDKY